MTEDEFRYGGKHKGESGAMRAMTDTELAEAESNAANSLRADLEHFLGFPVQRNAARVIDALSQYQHAWMNGRRRPVVKP